MRIYLCVYKHTHIYIYIYIYICVCLCVCVCVCVHMSLVGAIMSRSTKQVGQAAPNR